jgi:EAL domain-containing protein (putative c-di-GMP-specific phosphodiesterase class I)
VIEGDLQPRALRGLGCGVGQGFRFARPLPLAEAEVLVDAERRGGPRPHVDAA